MRLPATVWPVQYASSVTPITRSEEHTSELQSLRRISYAVFCLKKKKERHAFECSYCVDHRKDDDELTVKVPTTLAQSVAPEAIDWLVPGLYFFFNDTATTEIYTY